VYLNALLNVMLYFVILPTHFVSLRNYSSCSDL